MIRKVTALFLVMVIILSYPSIAMAATRAVDISPNLSFSNNVATCHVLILANTGDSIVATINLYEGNTCLKTWHCTGTGYLDFSQNVSVMYGYKYTLAVDAIINGIARPTLSIVSTNVL